MLKNILTSFLFIILISSCSKDDDPRAGEFLAFDNQRFGITNVTCEEKIGRYVIEGMHKTRNDPDFLFSEVTFWGQEGRPALGTYEAIQTGFGSDPNTVTVKLTFQNQAVFSSISGQVKLEEVNGNLKVSFDEVSILTGVGSLIKHSGEFSCR